MSAFCFLPPDEANFFVISIISGLEIHKKESYKALCYSEYKYVIMHSKI